MVGERTRARMARVVGYQDRARARLPMGGGRVERRCSLTATTGHRPPGAVGERTAGHRRREGRGRSLRRGLDVESSGHRRGIRNRPSTCPAIGRRQPMDLGRDRGPEVDDDRHRLAQIEHHLGRPVLQHDRAGVLDVDRASIGRCLADRTFVGEVIAGAGRAAVRHRQSMSNRAPEKTLPWTVSADGPPPSTGRSAERPAWQNGCHGR